jgi:hypothetical protein
MSDLASAARALLLEINKQRGLKVDRTGILDPLHPICIFAEHLQTALNNGSAEPATAAPTDFDGSVYVILEGGLCQDVVARDPRLVGIPFAVIDYDTDGADEDSKMDIPQSDGTISEALVWADTIGQATIETRGIDSPDDHERAARAAGWTRGGDGDGIIYNIDDYDSWKEAVSWSPKNGSVYGSWEECCRAEDIEVA